MVVTRCRVFNRRQRVCDYIVIANTVVNVTVENVEGLFEYRDDGVVETGSQVSKCFKVNFDLVEFCFFQFFSLFCVREFVEGCLEEETFDIW